DEPIWSSARSDAAISPSPVAATCGVRTLCGIPLPRGRGRLETVPTPYGSTRFRDRVPEPRPPRPIGSSRGTPPSRSWSRSDALAADDEAIDIVDDRDEERVLFEDGLQGRSAEADYSGETAGFRRGGIHHRRPTLRQAQHSRPVEGARASPGRELANAVARDYGARRPIRA